MAHHKKYLGRLSLARRLNTYGLSVEVFELMLLEQGTACALCLEPIDARKCQVDHCHVTGAVRGLLCGVCNAGLGFYERFVRCGALARIETYLVRGDGKAA